MINGALIHSLEYDDTHIGSVVHGSAVAAPLALAVAELAGASGRDLILGYIVAWEVAIRIGLAAPGDFQARGFQVTAVDLEIIWPGLKRQTFDNVAADQRIRIRQGRSEIEVLPFD